MIRAIATVLTTLLVVCAAGHASQSESGAEHHVRTGTSHGDEAVAVTFADLQSTVETLKRAQSATEKYLDVSTAEADGYRVFGPYVTGMGFHYVNTRLARAGF